MKKMIYRLFILITLFQANTILCARIGIRARFAEAPIENLEIGKTYTLSELGRALYTVINAGDTELNIETIVEVPSTDSLVEGYEPIPDVSWVKVVPDKFKLSPQEEMKAEVVISIPNDKKFAGKKYQAMLWSRSVGTGIFSVGVKSRLKFTTVLPQENVIKDEKNVKKVTKADIDFTPASIYISDIKPGEKYKLQHISEETLKIVNRSKRKLKVKLQCVPSQQETGLAKGYIPADVHWFKLLPKEFYIKPNSIKEINGWIKIPSKEEFYNKSYVAIIKAEVWFNTELVAEYYSRIYFTTKEKNE